VEDLFLLGVFCCQDIASSSDFTASNENKKSKPLLRWLDGGYRQGSFLDVLSFFALSKRCFVENDIIVLNRSKEYFPFDDNELLSSLAWSFSSLF
jgi:hypothetical protein